MTRKEAIQHLENMKWLKGYDNTTVNGRPLERVIDDIIDILKRSFSPKEVYDIVIEYAQHDKRFKLGDKIDYSFTDVVDILNMELMCKAGDM